MNSDGSLLKHKTRLVAKLFHQEQDFNYTKTFSPVVKPITIRVILTLAITYKWDIQQIDINNAFLNGTLHDEVYMVQPFRFESKDKNMVRKLNKATYGLKQALRAWYEKLTQALIHFGFYSSKCDHSLFIYYKQVCPCMPWSKLMIYWLLAPIQP